MLSKTNRKKLFAVCGVIVIAITGSCKYDKEELLSPAPQQPAACATVPASFATDVLPIITGKCGIQGCHDATASGGRIFQNYAQISAAKDRINARALIQKNMPPTGPLSANEINTLKCWIEGGALNN